MKRVFALLILFGCLTSLCACTPEPKQEEEDLVYVAPKTDTVRDTAGFYTNASVTETGVKTHTLSYTAEGVTKTEEGVPYTENGLVFTFDNPIGEGFNRLCFCYHASQNVRVTVKYAVSGTVTEDVFFLESGTDSVYGFISDFTAGKTADGVTEVGITSVSGKPFSFILYDLLTEKYDELPETYYLENDFYKLGIRLNMGGGVGYLEDKNCPVDGVTNLINNHDTGRLVQQSFYGTGGNKYFTPGQFMGHGWAYNPVQGGDRFGNTSRLVDFAVKGDSVYVKAQPLDWALENYITPSYMENVYTVAEEYVRVDNRFTDFSGWSHPTVTQEVPAFYTVSYFDTFSRYAGCEPWTNGALTVRSDLGFWGERSDQNFPFMYSNTETWSSWTHGADGYGIGLYVPGADMLVAGIYGSAGVKNAAGDSTSYVAPVVSLNIGDGSVAYSYLLTTGTAEEIRDTFTKYKDFAENETLQKDNVSLRMMNGQNSMVDIDLSEQSNASLLYAQYHCEAVYDADWQMLKLTATADDPQTRIRYELSAETLYAEDYDAIEIVYMTEVKNAGFELFLCTGDRTEAESGCSVSGEWVGDGRVHAVKIDLAGDAWSGKINAVRFDFFNQASGGESVYVKEIRLIKK